jgi:hypothetical protein
MADISDVENAVVAIIASSLGLGDTYLAGSLVLCEPVGVKCRVYRGWPVKGSLDDDIAAGIANITVFPVAGSTRNVTRHLLTWRNGPVVAPTITVSVSGNTVTFGGVGGPGQVAGFRYGPSSGGPSYAYRLTAQDTPGSVAAALAAMAPGVTALGATLTAPTDYGLQARVVADQPAWLETRRQDQQIWVIGWCPDPKTRDAIVSTVDAGFANMLDQYGRPTNQFGLPDGTNAVMRYVSNRTDDQPQQASLWRRDLRYRVEYATTLLQQQPEVLFIGGTINKGTTDITTEFGDLFPVATATVSTTQPDNTLAGTAAD